MEKRRRTQAGRRRYAPRSRYGVRCGYMYLMMMCFPCPRAVMPSDYRQQRRSSVALRVTLLHPFVDNRENSGLIFYDSVDGGGNCAIFNAERRRITHMT